MQLEALIETLCGELQKRHGCHTVVLYGSHARGDESPDSDYDLAGFRAGGSVVRDARMCGGAFIDLFIYPESHLSDPPADLLKLRNGIVLVEKNGTARNLLSQLESMFAAGPPRLPEDEIQARRVWAKKMLGRANGSDTESNYRRVWLLTALVEDYFSIRGLWYLGPKMSLQWLRSNDASTYDLLAGALKPDATIGSISMAVDAVVGIGSR